MKKIVILTDQISEIGGITSLIHIKANYWASKYGYRVYIITTEQKEKPSYYELDDRVKLIDLKIDYNRTISYFKPANFRKVLSNYLRLQKEVRTIKPDFIIIANHIPVTFFFPLLRTKAKFIKEFHFTKFNFSKKKKGFFRKFESFLESRLDHQIVLSEEEKTFYTHDNVLVIPNPIVLEKYRGMKEPVRSQVAVAAGRISLVKRFDKLISIWAKVIERGGDWKLEIYGDGDKKLVDQLNQQIEELDLMQYATIHKSTNSLDQVLRSSGMYVMTSIQECFPMVLLEAQSLGLPIVSFDCPTGPRNIISHGVDGIIVDMNDEEAFADHVINLIKNENYRNKLAENGYKNAENYSLEKVMDMWNEKVLN